ncbi:MULTISPECIES: S8 family serine peptidase [unclassified Lysobacter]|uniref:S8 family serine peptidase n=1 Tax=unclassified Lysobacter TaxID=2635362 RepID=UPI001BED19C2|nr:MULTISPECIES: S8 family serine peptidase [unclassified Lysobacter]MBT2748721.1 S8 family serine peptidase [Lysobacter sp. ISL-42]MBT2751656.1 S8 family serine peptidase [Lysobacter sp. ISL-50]MBT2775850.1 S8 family serine peptidase [Lysobacter sp. ISL-54]MBT2782186.1 S8 family serine peptidase [Lysobacter sp. ISL-52]
MAYSSKQDLRLRVLVTATVVALSSLVAAPALAGGPDLASLQSDTSFNQFIVKYRTNSVERSSASALTKSLSRTALALPADAKGRALGLSLKRRMSLSREVIRSDRMLDRVEAAALMRQIAADPNVESIEPDLLMHALVTPDDTRYTEQWHYHQPTGGFNLPAAWGKSTGAGVVVAVVDSGILAHADLDANILPGYDFVSSTSSGNAGSGDGDGRDADPTDSSNVQHGTHVAGTIAAVTNNASGVAGVAYDAKVVPLRALGNNGFGSTSDIIDAIVWASGGSVPGVPDNANPAEVINLSLGGKSTCTSTSVYQTAIDTAVGNGATVVVAAGNSNQDVSKYSPGGCSKVISVAAGDINGNRAFYSNYGASIDVTAPGGEVQSCTKSEFLPLTVDLDVSGSVTVANCGSLQSHPEKGVLSTVAGGGYGFYQGTSMATPHVAGVVALMQAVAKTPLTPTQVESTLKSSVREIPAANCPGGCGAGFVDVDAAVTAAAGGGTTKTYSNTIDYTINDYTTVNSPIVVSGRSGNAPNSASVTVSIAHPYQGDLKVDLVAPDGTLYNIHNRTGYGIDNVNKTVSLNLSSETLNGTWNLRVNDNAGDDTGKIDSWSITF